jgi:hypothetical protein
MNIGFFLVGAIIFSLYIGLTVWNIVVSNEKQRNENYPRKKKNVVVNKSPPIISVEDENIKAE